MAEKSKSTQLPLAEPLYHGKDVQVGKPVYYQLEDSEGGRDFARKSPAWINAEPTGERDEQGRLVFSVTVLSRFGVINKERVPFDSARTPGTIDSVQPADVGSQAV